MKNLLAFLLLALSVPAFAQSQTISPPKQAAKPAFSVSVVGGLNVNQMFFRLEPEFNRGSPSWNETSKARTAYFLGISANQPLNRRFAVKLDAQYVVRGFSYRSEALNPNILEHYQVSYLEFSPQIAVTFFQHFQLLLGGYGELRMQEGFKFKGEAWSVLNSDTGSLANKSDWGLVGGMSVQLDKVSLFGKYAYGLTSAWDTEYSSDTGDILESKLYHQSLQIGLGFKLL